MCVWQRAGYKHTILITAQDGLCAEGQPVHQQGGRPGCKIMLPFRAFNIIWPIRVPFPFLFFSFLVFSFFASEGIGFSVESL